MGGFGKSHFFKRGVTIKADRINKIFTYIHKLIIKRECIPDELVCDMVSELAKLISVNECRPDPLCYELIDKCENYRAFEFKQSEKFAYVMGIIWGATTLFKKSCIECELREYEQNVLFPSSIHFLLLKNIYYNPGISKSELENMTGSECNSIILLQALNSLLKNQYILFQNLRCEKRYFASSRGDEYIEQTLK